MELLLENPPSRKQRQRSAFDPIRGPQPNLTLTLEERARNLPANIFRKRQRAVVQINMEIRPVNRGIPNVIYALRIESDRTNPRVKSTRRWRTVRARFRPLRQSFSRQQQPREPDHPPQPNHRWLHK